MKHLIILLFVLFQTLFSIPFTATDLHSLYRLSSPATNGEYVVFSVNKWDASTHDKYTNLKYTHLATRKTFDLTPPQNDVIDTNPVFSPKFPDIVFFLSNRDGINQVYYIGFPPLKDEQPVKLTDSLIDVNNLKIKGLTLAFTAEVYPDCPDFKCTVDLDAERAKRGSNTYSVFDSLMVRHWDKWDNNKVSHVFVHKLEALALSDKTIPVLKSDPIDTIKGLNTYSPVPPNGGAEQYDISDDGNELVLTTNDRDFAEAWRTDWKITYVRLGDNGEAFNSKITEDFVGRTQNPRFSPDASKIAFVAMNRKGSESDALRLHVFDKTTTQFYKIDHDFDRSIDNLMWVDDHTLILLCADHGVDKLFTVSFESLDKPAKISLLFDDAISVISFTLISPTTLLLERYSFVRPNDLWTLDLKSLAAIQITNVNKELLSSFEFTEPESFTFVSGGDKVDAWIFKPINFNSKKKYPLAFLIHGGPESPWVQSFSYRWNPELWVNKGFAVLMVNPHGSPGQGQKFTDGVINNWGGQPYEDLMKAVDEVGLRYEWADIDNACACGASYGGFMINWIQGQTDRFKCLVTHDGVFSTVSMFYATEEMWFPYAEYCPLDKPGCSPYKNGEREGYEKWNPERYIKNWKTPHLVIHGDKDYRIPISEGLSVFNALQLKRIPSKLVVFHEENHWVLRRENSIKWYEEVLGWLDKWLSKEKDDRKVQKILKIKT